MILYNIKKRFENLTGRILLIEDSTSFKNPIPK